MFIIKKFLSRTLLLAGLAGVAHRSAAQLVSGNIFLQGSFIEVGIAPNGSFGSDVDAPSGYHPRSGTFSGGNGIGFVADPAKDGWTVGSPAYYGDYFMPGSPQEGWDIQVNNTRYFAWRNISGTFLSPGMSGSNTGYSAAGGKVTSVWSGAIGDLSITQTTQMKTDKLYFVITVELKNNGTGTLRNMYYNRTVDPDNDRMLTPGSFETRNKIESKIPSISNKTLVTARGYYDTTAYLGLGSKDCRARPYIIDSSLVPNDPLPDIYNGTGAAADYHRNQGDTVTADVGMGIVFFLDTLGPGASTSLSYAYILKPADIDSAFADIEPQWSYNGANYQSGDTIKVCSATTMDLSIINAGYYDTWSWTPASGLSTSTAARATVTVGSSPVTYTATGTSSICGTSIATTITILPQITPGAPTVSSPVNLCIGGTATPLTATGSNLLWYTTASGGTGSATAPTPSTSTTGSVTYYVSQSNWTCESPRAAIVVNVGASSRPVVSSPVKRCINGPSAPLTASGVNLLWYTTPTGGTGSAMPPTPSTGAAGATTYYVTQSVPPLNCESERQPVTVIVSGLPDAGIRLFGVTAASDSCFKTGSTLEAYASPAAAAFKWYENGAPIAGATSSTLIPDTSTYYSVMVTDINGCQDSASVFVYDDLLSNPVLSPTDLRICPGVAVMLYCRPAIAGYTYSWERDGAAFASGTSSEYAASATGTYLVRVTDNMGCIKLSNTSTLSTYPESSKPNLQRLGTLLQLDHVYSSYTWYRNNKVIAGANARSYTLPFDGTYYAIVMDSYGCIKYSDTLTISALGIENLSLQDGVRIYPNPASGVVQVAYSSPLLLRVSDMTGKTVLEAAQANAIDLSPLADGLYIISCIDADGIVLHRETVTKNAAAQQ